MTFNNDLPLPFSSFMPWWFEEVFRLLAFGFVVVRLVLPAYCTTFVPCLLALLVPGCAWVWS